MKNQEKVMERLLKLIDKHRKKSPDLIRAEKEIIRRTKEIQNIFGKAYGGKISDVTQHKINQGLAALALKGYLQ